MTLKIPMFKQWVQFYLFVLEKPMTTTKNTNVQTKVTSTILIFLLIIKKLTYNF